MLKENPDCLQAGVSGIFCSLTLYNKVFPLLVNTYFIILYYENESNPVKPLYWVNGDKDICPRRKRRQKNN
jgi:hypothetical protein